MSFYLPILLQALQWTNGKFLKVRTPTNAWTYIRLHTFTHPLVLTHKNTLTHTKRAVSFRIEKMEKYLPYPMSVYNAEYFISIHKSESNILLPRASCNSFRILETSLAPRQQLGFPFRCHFSPNPTWARSCTSRPKGRKLAAQCTRVSIHVSL